jgi:hypothetical protein
VQLHFVLTTAIKLGTFLIGVGLANASAQLYPSTSYADFSKRQYKSTQAVAPSFSPRQYTIDRIYYHSPTISPYLNLARQQGSVQPTYFSRVKPEIQRRTADARANLPPSLVGSSSPLRSMSGPTVPNPLAKYYHPPY